MQKSAGLLMACLLAGAMVAPANAQGAMAGSPPEFARRADTLKPGEWVWAPQVARDGPVLVFVDLSRQIAMVYRNGVRIAATTVSSGKPGHETPTGVFTVLQKDAKHRSQTYNNAPMPFTQRLTWGGIALHAGGLPGYPESHGCVHLPYDFARELFAVTKLGITVVVQGDAAIKTPTASNSLLSPFDAKGRPIEHRKLAEGEVYRWQPELSREGSLTIILAKLDQRVVVLRNGVEIGRSVAEIDPMDDGSHVMTLQTKDGHLQWQYVGLPGHEREAGRLVDVATLRRLKIPAAFFAALSKELKPGDTILSTNSRVANGAMQRLTIFDAISPAAPENGESTP